MIKPEIKKGGILRKDIEKKRNLRDVPSRKDIRSLGRLFKTQTIITKVCRSYSYPSDKQEGIYVKDLHKPMKGS